MDYPKLVVIFVKGPVLVKVIDFIKNLFEYFGYNFADWFSGAL